MEASRPFRPGRAPPTHARRCHPNSGLRFREAPHCGVQMKFDVIRAVEACYAAAHDYEGWLNGLLEALRSLEDEPQMFARVARVGADGQVAFEFETWVGSMIQPSELEENHRFENTLPAAALQALYAPAPPVDYGL